MSSGKEYGRKPYIAGSYRDMMDGTSNKFVWDKFAEAQSEHEKPYYTDTYSEMQYEHPAVPGINPDTNAEFDFNPFDPTTQPIELGMTVFYCGGEPCYCEGDTKCIPLGCTHPVVDIQPFGCDPCVQFEIRGKGHTLCITVPKGCSTFGCHYYVWMLAYYTGGGFAKVQISTKLPRPVRGSHGKILNECDDCGGCTGISIGYTTQQMAVNETQTLTAEGAAEGCTYTWGLSGGGSLSANEGTSVVYTAPSTNANCANNPTIALVCDGKTVGELQIAVNAVTDAPCVAAYQAGCLGIRPTAGSPGWWCCFVPYNCMGEIRSCDCGTCSTSCATYGCSQASSCGPCNVSCQGDVDAYSGDVRSDAQKEAGCCPAQLL